MMAGMFTYEHEVSHEWQRRQTLRELKRGHLPIDEVCDADFLLRELDELMLHLDEYAQALRARDAGRLRDLLRDGREKKMAAGGC